ncbi:LysR substrate-binding domain-containing protein [Jannaschia marina]|uniref:LysR substrate-binding domain-containing protein n=1 Tax=Jannaschia marina TaxID=2741674 RepID=UPI001F1AF64A|nr:LysR substrate-binding domain-containing protein [Jannaschia marina]
MRRTPRAEALRAPLKSALAEVTALIDPPVPALREIERTIRITAADDPAALLLRPLMAALAREAPGVSVVIRPWRGAGAALRDLHDGETDLALSVFDAAMDGLETRRLLKARYVVAMRRDHPAAADFGLEAWLDWPHVLVSGRGDSRTPLDAHLAPLGRHRRIGATVPAFHLVPPILRASDHVAMLPRPSLALHGDAGLATFAPPLPVAGFPLRLAWHVRQSGEPALAHVVATLEATFRDIVA